MKKGRNKIVKIPMRGLTVIEELNALRKKFGVIGKGFVTNEINEQVAGDALEMHKAVLKGEFKDISTENL